MKRCHIMVLPFPGRGLINPMMNCCKHLAHKLDYNVKITFVVTEEWLGILQSVPMPPQIHLRSTPNVIPSEIVVAKMEAPFVHVLNTSEPTTVVIADFSLIWAVSIGNARNIPVVSFWRASSFMFSMMCDRLYSWSFSNTISRQALLPGGNDPKLNPEMVPFTMLDKVQCLLLATFYELEPQVTDSKKTIFPFPSYLIGPSISNITNTTESSTSKYVNDKEHYYLEWLDSQPIRSVLYIAFGSTILAGLRETRIRYLLVSRGGHLTSSVHGDGGGDDNEIGTSSSRRLVVRWRDQLRVLCHSSVGGFWTHCGWNSIMESIYAGVPMLTFPIHFDQIPNRKLIVDDLKVGMKKFMNINGEAKDVNNEAKEMCRRSSELKEMCRRTLAKGGSSDTNLDAFIKDIPSFPWFITR
ncbi:hypothetical protein MKX01_018756 [Papaver californicum]|nr:hypothetical protein MKX01_018756 [Papaver californicum]